MFEEWGLTGTEGLIAQHPWLLSNSEAERQEDAIRQQERNTRGRKGDEMLQTSAEIWQAAWQTVKQRKRFKGAGAKSKWTSRTSTEVTHAADGRRFRQSNAASEHKPGVREARKDF